MKEGIDYELVPVEWAMNEQAWDVRILTGDYTETVVRFGNVAVDGKTDNLTFNFKVIESTEELDPDTNIELQDVCADVLVDIIEQSIDNKSLVIKDKGESIE